MKNTCGCPILVVRGAVPLQRPRAAAAAAAAVDIFYLRLTFSMNSQTYALFQNARCFAETCYVVIMTKNVCNIQHSHTNIRGDL